MRKLRHREVTTVLPKVTQSMNSRAGMWLKAHLISETMPSATLSPHSLCSVYFISFCLTGIYEVPSAQTLCKTIVGIEKRGDFVIYHEGHQNSMCVGGWRTCQALHSILRCSFCPRGHPIPRWWKENSSSVGRVDNPFYTEGKVVEGLVH